MPSRILESSTDPKSQVSPDNARFSATTFTDPDLDPIEYLNNNLPRLSINTASSHNVTSSLTDISSSTQSFLSQLNAYSSQLSTDLTQLTDEILRSGSRLAYEVEILRGDTIGLSDALTDTLQRDIGVFKASLVTEEKSNGQSKTASEAGEQPEDISSARDEPGYILKLRMLNQVKARLEEVITAFGEAMEWPLAPSDVSVTSSFISVSAPEQGPDARSQEEKGSEVAEKLRNEIQTLTSGGRQDIAAAARRVEHLRSLVLVWKGTAEEKARTKFVDSVAKVVEDKSRALGIEAETTGPEVRTPNQQTANARVPSTVDTTSNKGGLFRNLQRLRDEIYLE
ncbi:hypothetical protein UCRPC4_g03071 [Phaeomoniella chlamydospora]|uniref:Uncharacterized protein n=1 Tax=Phaeomoniella chlamydospora TaxID=158046 RepID=A0A0G2EL66_PHACM|nr:hypothetical protein UCRPC4_g03071 [Phaeomoniella chlamydospora]